MEMFLGYRHPLRGQHFKCLVNAVTEQVDSEEVRDGAIGDHGFSPAHAVRRGDHLARLCRRVAQASTHRKDSPKTLPAPPAHVSRISETHHDFAPLQVNCISDDWL